VTEMIQHIRWCCYGWCL